MHVLKISIYLVKLNIMRDINPASQQPQKNQSKAVSPNDNNLRFPLTRFSEKISKKAAKKKQLFTPGKIDRAIANSIHEKGLARMLQKVPRKEE